MSDIRNYLFSRIKRDDYRGAHVAQHNRLPFGKAASLLSTIHGVVGEGNFRFRLAMTGRSANPDSPRFTNW